MFVEQVNRISILTYVNMPKGICLANPSERVGWICLESGVSLCTSYERKPEVKCIQAVDSHLYAWAGQVTWFKSRHVAYECKHEWTTCRSSQLHTRLHRELWSVNQIESIVTTWCSENNSVNGVVIRNTLVTHWFLKM